MKYVFFVIFFCGTEWRYRQNDMKTSPTKKRKNRRWICRNFWNTLNAELCARQMQILFFFLVVPVKVLVSFRMKIVAPNKCCPGPMWQSPHSNIAFTKNPIRFVISLAVGCNTKQTHITTICNESLAILHICTCWTVRWDGAAANVLRMRMNGQTHRDTQITGCVLATQFSSLFCTIVSCFALARCPSAIYSIFSHSATPAICSLQWARTVSLRMLSAKHMRKSAPRIIIVLTLRKMDYYCPIGYEVLWLAGIYTAHVGGGWCVSFAPKFYIHLLFIVSLVLYSNSFVSSKRFSCGCKQIAIGTKARTYVSMLWINKCTIVVRWCGWCWTQMLR